MFTYLNATNCHFSTFTSFTRTPNSHPQKNSSLTSLQKELLVLHSSCVLVCLYASPIPQVNSLAPGSRRISVWDPPWRMSCLGWDPRIFEPKKTGVWRPAGSVLEIFAMNQKDPLARHGWAQEGWNWWCEFFCGRFAEHWCCWWQYPTKNLGNHGRIPDIYIYIYISDLSQEISYHS